MAVDNPESKIVVIDTDSYAGNFEREMCAFITGQVGECHVGSGVAWEEEENIRHLSWFKDHIAQEEDDDQCARPASIWQTPGRFNDGYGGHYDDTPEVRASLDPRCASARHPAYESVAIFVDELPPDEVLAEMVERAQAYCAEHGIKYRGCRLLEPQYAVKEVQVHVGHLEVLRKVVQEVSNEEIHVKLLPSA
jgi:hypothetical protein